MVGRIHPGRSLTVKAGFVGSKGLKVESASNPKRPRFCCIKFSVYDVFWVRGLLFADLFLRIYKVVLSFGMWRYKYKKQALYRLRTTRSTCAHVVAAI